MNTLHQNWLTEGIVDFEYKKFVLLAYLQNAAKNFDEEKLYPKLAELVEHYRHLKLFRESKLSAQNNFPKEISKVDFEKFKVEYRQMFDDSELLKEIDEIVEFALPEIENHISLGKELYEEVEHRLEIFPVGIVSLHNHEGYFFLSDFFRKLTNVYSYRITVFESALEKFRGINAEYLFTYNTSLSRTYESVKYDLLEKNSSLQNTAAYAVEFKKSFPLPETMLPVAKRSLVKYISK